jgi:membrane peptidoglycan carboxypeptidase
VAAAARALGVNAELSETPALALGASGVTLIDMVEAYAALATGRGPVHARGLAGIRTGADGAYHPFRWSDGSSDSEAAQLLEHREALTAMLRAAVTDGTGSAAETPAGSAGKTGTSQDNRDALFIGWSGELIVGVWVGNDDNTPMQDVTGGGLPAQIFAAFQTAAADAGETAARSAPPAPDSSAAVATRGTSQPGTDLPDPQTLAEKLEAALSQAREPTASCNIRACERHYRSFRASDCTFQPYGGGPRKLCTR